VYLRVHLKIIPIINYKRVQFWPGSVAGNMTVMMMVMMTMTTTMMMNVIIMRNKMTKIMTKTTTTIFSLVPKQLYDPEHIHVRNLF